MNLLLPSQPLLPPPCRHRDTNYLFNGYTR